MSLFAGTCTMNQGTRFVNVIGSTDDPPVTEHSLNPYDDSIRRVSWLTLWNRECNGGKTDTLCIACGTRRAKVGGHVVLRGTESDATRYAGLLKGCNRVFIVPICEVCNGQDWDSGREKIFSAQRTIDIVHLWAFWEDCELDEQSFEEKHSKLSVQKLRKALSEARTKYENSLNERKPQESVLNSSDETALRNASPALPSDSSQGSPSSGPSWGSPVAQTSSLSLSSPVAQPSDFWKPNGPSFIYYDSGSEFQSDSDDLDFLL